MDTVMKAVILGIEEIGVLKVGISIEGVQKNEIVDLLSRPKKKNTERLWAIHK